MATTIADRQLFVQLQVGVSTNGQPKLQKRMYPHVDPTATDVQISQVLSALTPLFADTVYTSGFVDTVEIMP